MYKYINIKQKIVLTPQCNVRLETIKFWLKNNINFNKLIFSDEKYFSRNGPDNFMTWSLEDEKIDRKRRQSRGGGVMVFGYCISDGTIKLNRVDGQINAQKYQNIISVHIDDFQQSYKDHFFMQDNTRPHTAKSILSFFLGKWYPFI